MLYKSGDIALRRAACGLPVRRPLSCNAIARVILSEKKKAATWPCIARSICDFVAPLRSSVTSSAQSL
jgi:hypothetical protein